MPACRRQELEVMSWEVGPILPNSQLIIPARGLAGIILHSNVPSSHPISN